MRQAYFVSRDTGHPLVRDFRSDDFKGWYDPLLGCISPILATTFTAPDWTPVLANGNGAWTVGHIGNESWDTVFAAAEKRVGEGCIRICQVTLAGRTQTDPVADIFARRLLGKGEKA